MCGWPAVEAIVRSSWSRVGRKDCGDGIGAADSGIRHSAIGSVQMESSKSETTASDKIDRILYQEIMRERCEVQGHSFAPVTTWRGGFPGPVIRTSHRKCEWCDEVRL